MLARKLSIWGSREKKCWSKTRRGSTARNCEKFESLNKRALRIVFNDKFRPTSSYYIIQEEQLYTTKGYKICKSLSTNVCTMKVFLNILKTCLLCVSLCTLLEEIMFYHYVNLLLLLTASTLFVTLHLRNGTPYLM